MKHLVPWIQQPHVGLGATRNGQPRLSLAQGRPSDCLRNKNTLVYPLCAHSSGDQARAKSGAENGIQVSHATDRTQLLELSQLPPPLHWQEVRSRSSGQAWKQVLNCLAPASQPSDSPVPKGLLCSPASRLSLLVSFPACWKVNYLRTGIGVSRVSRGIPSAQNRGLRIADTWSIFGVGNSEEQSGKASG